MKNRRWTLVYTTTAIVCAVILSFSLFIYLWIGKPITGGSPNIPTAAFNSSKEDDNYTITVLRISFPTKNNDVRWVVTNESDCSIASSDFPIMSGDAGSTTNRSIIVTWFDIDHDGKLSTNDTIRVYRGWHNLDGYKFRLFYKTYNEIAYVKFQ